MVITLDELSHMKNTNPLLVDKDSLVDINDVEIDVKLSQPERLKQFLTQIKNPYCFKCGDFIVKSTFSEDDITLAERLKQLI